MKMQTIELDHGNLKVQTKAYVFGEWAAHRNPDGEGWRVSHVPSGHAVKQLQLRGCAVFVAMSLNENVPHIELIEITERAQHEPRYSVSVEHGALVKSTIAEALRS